MRYFARSTMGFYLKAVHGRAIPADAVEISDELFDYVVTHRPASKVIVTTEDGLPALEDLALPTADQLLRASHAAKVLEIDNACEAVITAGFDSSALGLPYRYSSELPDQLNLTGSILSGNDILYPCYDELGLKAFRLHTAEQLHQVGDDFTRYKLQLLQRANQLKQELDQALATGDADAMQAITWEAAES